MQVAAWLAEDDQDRPLDPTTREYRQIEDKLAELGKPTSTQGCWRRRFWT